jgi:Flp pilus assembly protein TadG
MIKPDRETTYAGSAGFRAGRPSHANKVGLRGEHGQAVTEFAMVVPLFAALMIVCVLFGKAIYSYIQLTHSANEAARLATVNQPQGPAGALCTTLSNEFALPKGVTLTISYPDGGSQGVGEPVKIDASTSGSWLKDISLGTLGTIHATATMRIEQNTTFQADGATPNNALAAGACSS